MALQIRRRRSEAGGLGGCKLIRSATMAANGSTNRDGSNEWQVPRLFSNESPPADPGGLSHLRSTTYVRENGSVAKC
jgi:hypothetical protein